ATRRTCPLHDVVDVEAADVLEDLPDDRHRDDAGDQLIGRHFANAQEAEDREEEHEVEDEGDDDSPDHGKDAMRGGGYEPRYGGRREHQHAEDREQRQTAGALGEEAASLV